MSEPEWVMVFNVLVPETRVLQPEQLKHPGAIRFSFELHS